MTNVEKDNMYMQRALELAIKGLGRVSPNPLVGCIIVHDNKVIGEGWHEHYGEGHAEVNAIKAVEDKELLKESTVYVTLEPCSHHGKTPPCAELLIKHKVKEVVIANEDPNPIVAGNGINILKNGGVTVRTGVFKDSARELNKRFFTFMEQKRPYIILKWAQTLDGFIAREDFDSKWISCDQSRKLVHKWRGEEPGIMVATHTAHYDNPRLDVRDWSGKNPTRIVIDKKLELKNSLNVFDGTIPTICYNLIESKCLDSIEWVKLGSENFLNELLTDLRKKGIQSILVEGGASLHKSLINAHLWDEARVFVSDKTFGGGIDAAKINLPYQEELIGEDKLLVYRKMK